MNAKLRAEIRESLVGYIWDAYKDVNGIRPRWMNFDAMSDAELKSIADGLESEIIAENERTRAHREAVLAVREGKAEGYLVLDSRYDPKDFYDSMYIADSESMGDYSHWHVMPAVHEKCEETAMAAAFKRAM